ncbi:calpain-8-like [Eleutherodactylus coqui]|uniref:calpain-8-like n=1 Tax=Eleutherodactylus coqui TaxID=57060 RepID=UPI0034630AD1
MSGVASKIAQERAKAAGVGSLKNPVKFAGQDFEKLKAKCSKSGKLFEDPKFPANSSSLGIKKLGPDAKTTQGIEWKRPSEIQENPIFIADGANREDVEQGSIGDCWFLSSIASLTTNQDCMTHVIPQDQSFKKNYAGIFHFTFWQFGEWVDVVVDDKLPTKNSRLKFLKSGTVNEFWTPLLEKAYAKVYGSYEALIGGRPVESLEDFTAGVGFIYKTASAPADLFQKIQTALAEKCLIACSSVPKTGYVESVNELNIVSGHAYSITRVAEVIYGENSVQLIRVRNPWGYKEWSGAWSDNSKEWDNVDPKVKSELHKKVDDGEVWIAFPDFLKYYFRVDICDISLSRECCGDECRWCLTEFNGSWKKGSSAGGRADLDTFWINPQYRITLKSPDGDTSKKCTIIVSLIQKDRRKKKPEGVKNLYIGFYIYEVTSSDQIPLGKEFFDNNTEVDSMVDYKPYREAVKKSELLPGEYIIVPSTFDELEESDFYIRVFTEQPIEAKETESSVQANIYEPVITPETDAEFETVKVELEKGEFKEDEVKALLNKMIAKYPDIKCDGFSTEAVRQLIKLMDVDNTGTLSTEEFKKAWLKVANYMNIFKSADADNSGTISVPEFRNAMQKAGFTLKISHIDDVVGRLMNRNQVKFVEFILSMLHLETVINLFKILDRDEAGSISLSFPEFLSTAMA